MDALVKAIVREAKKRNHNMSSGFIPSLDFLVDEIFSHHYSEEKGREYLHGYKGIKFLFDVPPQDVQRIKRVIKDAVVQEGPGKPFKFDIKLAAELYEKAKQSNNQ